MGLTKLKFSIKHPHGVNVIRFRINYKEYDQVKIYSYQTSSSPDISIEGEMELNLVRKYITIEIEAVGSPNLQITYNVEYKDKKLLKGNEGNMVIDQSTGRIKKTNKRVELFS
ncbi:MAG: hypothetical protein NTV31_16890 [Bacteroidia bacterium]|nr:hypothetical protein [Bacteroidia bacterium]